MSSTTATRTTPLAGTYDIDASHSSVELVARHLVVSKVRGRFASFSGVIEVGDDLAGSSVTAELDAASIHTSDEKRDEHLRSADFLDVETYPTVTFASTSVTPKSGAEFVLNGDLTLHGVTKPISLTVNYEGATQDPWGNSREVFSAKGEVEREDFDITWNQALEAGGVMVGKTLKVELEIQGVKRA